MDKSSHTETAFLETLESHKGILYKVARAYSQNSEDQQDLIQEMSLQLWRAYPSYDDRYKFTTWMYRIALNVAISWFRKARKRQRRETSLEHTSQVWASKPLPEKTGEIQLLHQFIDQLKELDRALMLLYLEERSYEEIGEILGISPSNVGTKLNRIKNKLRKKFAAITN